MQPAVVPNGTSLALVHAVYFQFSACHVRNSVHSFLQHGHTHTHTHTHKSRLIQTTPARCSRFRQAEGAPTGNEQEGSRRRIAEHEERETVQKQREMLLVCNDVLEVSELHPVGIQAQLAAKLSWNVQETGAWHMVRLTSQQLSDGVNLRETPQ